jgi:hypothetical protein
MLQQYNFGAGTLFLVRTDIAVPTPVRVGTLQNVTIDMSFTVKELYGQYQAPVAVARAQQKITGKAKIANLNARQLNDTFLGQTLATGEQIQIVDEGGPNGTAIRPHRIRSLSPMVQRCRRAIQASIAACSMLVQGFR